MTEPLLIQKLNTQISYLSERQTLLSQNIANIDTPGYHAKDLKKLDFDGMVNESGGHLVMRTTSPKHISTMQKGERFAVDSRFEAVNEKPGGNNVILEEQMGNISDVGAQHQMASTLLRKFHQLYRNAATIKG
jgi:flagellar basal-body rod protein FlgB